MDWDKNEKLIKGLTELDLEKDVISELTATEPKLGDAGTGEKETAGLAPQPQREMQQGNMRKDSIRTGGADGNAAPRDPLTVLMEIANREAERLGLGKDVFMSGLL